MDKPRFQDYVDELTSGETYGIFIDDTGSPGIQGAPENFHPERKTWVAVIVPPTQIAEVMEQMRGALEELRRSTGAGEFHFTDIYSGRRQFKDVSLQVRLAIFEFMAHVFSEYNFPIVVQTFDPETLADVRARSNGRLPDAIPPFDFRNCSDLALFFLLIRLKQYVQDTTSCGRAKARVFIDEGFKSNGVIVRLPTFEDVFADGHICFADSLSIYPIQLADFAAFSLNRVQLLGGKDQRSSLDLRLLQILSPVAFNYVNIDRKELPLSHQGPMFTLADTRPYGPHPSKATEPTREPER